MAFIPLPNGVKWAIKFSFDGREPIVTGWSSGNHNAGTGDLDAINGQIVSWLSSVWAPLASSACSVLDVTSSDQSSITGPVVTSTPTSPIVGALTTAAADQQACMVVTAETGLRGKNFRGRQYWPALTLAQRANTKSWMTSVAAQYQAALVSLNANLSSIVWPMVVASHHFNKLPRTVAISTLIAGFRGNTRIGSQRRRTGRVA